MGPMQAVRRRIGVILPNGPAYFTQVFAGIGAYCRGRHQWQFVVWPSMALNLRDVRKMVMTEELDGVIGQASAWWRRVVAERKIAFVNAEYSRQPYVDLPRVGLDEVAIARLASAHFAERGYRNVAVLGQSGSLPSEERLIAFTEAARAWCPAPPHVRRLPYNQFDEGLAAWVAALPKPIGLFCWNDETAKVAHQLCADAGARVPDDVAILGADNDETICHFLDPELSSIDCNAKRIGYEAAALLDRLMQGRPAPKKPILVPPIGVVTRASTDILALDSPDVVLAIRFIRDHAGAPIAIKDVLDHVAVSRRSLEKQFQRVLGRTPRSELHRVLVDRAKDLLANTDLAIPAVADRCGYARPNHFSTMFRKQTGQSPTAYRRQTRLT